MATLTQTERQNLLNERRSNKCHCGARKTQGRAFCNAHFAALPASLRPGLTQLLGRGYEPAYMAAREYLESIKPQPSLIR